VTGTQSQTTPSPSSAPMPVATLTTATSPTSSDSSPPQRRLPPSVGRPQRPHPLHRHQALPPPHRWRPRPALRIPAPSTRVEHEPGRLHPRARLRRPRRSCPARQLGRQPGRRRSAGACPADQSSASHPTPSGPT
jgi:hypothetical protein